MIVGVLPAVGNGLIHMRRTGQLERLYTHLEGYGGFCIYFSYAARSGEAALWDGRLGVLQAPAESPERLFRYALLRPFLDRDYFRACNVLRCTSLLGAVPAIVARLAFGIPFVFTYGADYLKIAELHGRSRMHLRKWRWLRAAAMRCAAAVIVQNGELAETLQRQHPTARIHVIPNWVDTDRFTPPAPRRPVPRTVLYVGRLVREKNLVLLAQACHFSRHRLICVGEGPLREELSAWGAVLEGPRPWTELPRYHAEAEVFAMVSHTEGHCKALAEAMASGMPCLVSRAVTEQMRQGVNCLRVDPDEVSIRLALEVLMGDPDFAARLGAEARETAVRHWSRKALLTRELALLAAVAR